MLLESPTDVGGPASPPGNGRVPPVRGRAVRVIYSSQGPLRAWRVKDPRRDRHFFTCHPERARHSTEGRASRRIWKEGQSCPDNAPAQILPSAFGLRQDDRRFVYARCDDRRCKPTRDERPATAGWGSRLAASPTATPSQVAFGLRLRSTSCAVTGRRDTSSIKHPASSIQHRGGREVQRPATSDGRVGEAARPHAPTPPRPGRAGDLAS